MDKWSVRVVKVNYFPINDLSCVYRYWKIELLSRPDERSSDCREAGPFQPWRLLPFFETGSLCSLSCVMMMYAHRRRWNMILVLLRSRVTLHQDPWWSEVSSRQLQACFWSSDEMIREGLVVVGGVEGPEQEQRQTKDRDMLKKGSSVSMCWCFNPRRIGWQCYGFLIIYYAPRNSDGNFSSFQPKLRLWRELLEG